jgi:hypothetical protein
MMKDDNTKLSALFKLLLGIMLLADLSFSAYQHFHTPLGGDMPDVILPSPGHGYYEVLHDPFGLNVLLHSQSYANPNRFFAHWSASNYFKNVPVFLQRFTGPIDSVYLSSAIIKILTQALIIYLLAFYISNSGSVFNKKFLLAAVLVTPFFQAAGFCRTMGIIDQSVIYTFFYAFPLALLLLFFLPFFRKIYYWKNKPIGLPVKVLLAVLIIVLALNGPLIPGVVLIACPLFVLSAFIKNYREQGESVHPASRAMISIKKIPGFILWMFTFFCLMSLYSLFIGMNNSLNLTDTLSLAGRFERIPTGIYNLLTKKIAFPLILSVIVLNTIIINKYYKTGEGRKIINLLKWFGIFAVVYILLLPFGGYRGYRENIVRYDTIMPVTLGLLFFFGKTTFYLAENIIKRSVFVYGLGIVAVLAIFTVADSLDTRHYNCERNAIEQLADSAEKTVHLKGNCPVMDWKIITNPGMSASNAELFRYWNITQENKLYYQSEQGFKP